MAYRYTNTDKWNDSWFSNLEQLQMLLFLYLCDNCDCAGFIEINYKRWANDLSSTKEKLQATIKGLHRGLIFSKDNEVLYIRNFLKHQKNLPLNIENNKAHKGIYKRFEQISYKFEIHNIIEFIEGACKGLYSPTGNGISISKGKIELDYTIINKDVLPIYMLFVEMRTKIKHPIKTQLSINEHCELLNKYDIKTQIEIIKKSISSEYQGLFEPKEQNYKSSFDINKIKEIKTKYQTGVPVTNAESELYQNYSNSLNK